MVNEYIQIIGQFPTSYIGYLIAVAMLLKRHFRALVIKGIAVNRQIAIAAAIKPYSIAVAPDSSFTKLFMFYPHPLLEPYLNPGFDELLVIFGF
jgi:hypothetical protein